MKPLSRNVSILTGILVLLLFAIAYSALVNDAEAFTKEGPAKSSHHKQPVVLRLHASYGDDVVAGHRVACFLAPCVLKKTGDNVLVSCLFVPCFF